MNNMLDWFRGVYYSNCIIYKSCIVIIIFLLLVSQVLKVFLLLVVGSIIFFSPTIVAHLIDYKKTDLVFVYNLFLQWIIVGIMLVL